MNFDWSTFVLEAVNFLILLWILRRFLYQPILETLQARKQRIDSILQDAHQRQAEAVAAREALELNLGHWDQEKANARMALEQEIDAERERRLNQLNAELAETRARQQAHETYARQEWQRLTERQALRLGGQFMLKLLQRLASPELENRLILAFLEELSQLSAEQTATLKTALRDDGLEVVSAFVLSSVQRETLVEALTRISGCSVTPAFREDTGLISGLRIHAAAWVLGANLQDELKFFLDLENRGMTE